MSFCHRKPLLGFILTLAILLMFAACGGDDDDAGEIDSDPTATEDAGGGEETADGDEGNGSGDDGDDSGSDDDGGLAGTIDACSLLTPDEITLVLGDGAGEGDAQTFADTYTCVWLGAGSDSITVTVLTGNASGLDAYYDQLYLGAEDVGGLGDRASWQEFFVGGVVAVRLDDSVVELSVLTDETGDDAKDLTTGLAERVIGRLQ